jgi:xylose isomerase
MRSRYRRQIRCPLRKEARELKKNWTTGIAAEIVAPRLWFSPMTIDGAYTSNDPKCRKYAIERSLRCIDVANVLDCDLIVLWLAREGSYLRESKNARQCVDHLVEAIDKMLAHDKKIRIAIEPKPNEPMDVAYIPTIGHALAVAQLTAIPNASEPHRIRPRHPRRLDPADEIDFACAFNKLWSIHLNDQNGLKFDQDKPFASANLRVAFNQVRALERNGYGKNGEYVAFDVHPFRPTKVEHWLKHLDNSRRTFLPWSKKPAPSTKPRPRPSSPTAITRTSTRWSSNTSWASDPIPGSSPKPTLACTSGTSRISALTQSPPQGTRPSKTTQLFHPLRSRS